MQINKNILNLISSDSLDGARGAARRGWRCCLLAVVVLLAARAGSSFESQAAVGRPTAASLAADFADHTSVARDPAGLSSSPGHRRDQSTARGHRPGPVLSTILAWWSFLRSARWIDGLAAAAVLLLFMLLGLLYRYQRHGSVQWDPAPERGIRSALEEERKRIAQDLHDDLGTRLTQIALLSATASQPATPTSQTRQYLERINGQTEAMVQSLDEIVWAINPGNDSTDSVVNYFCLYAQDFLQTAGIRCRLDIDRDLPECQLSPEPRHHLLMAFKEALNNVVRHSGASEVRLRITAQGNHLILQVSDNGRGWSGDLLPAGADGLKNMHRRLARLGGRCRMDHGPQQGTIVEFSWPVSSAHGRHREKGGRLTSCRSTPEARTSFTKWLWRSLARRPIASAPSSKLDSLWHDHHCDSRGR